MADEKRNNLKMAIPHEIADELDMRAGDAVKIRVTDNNVVIESTADAEEKQDMRIRWFTIPAVVATVLFWGFFLIRQEYLVPLTGRLSISGLTIILGVVSGVASFSTFYVRNHKIDRNRALKGLYWRNFPVILLSFGIILALSLLAIFWFMGIIFKGAAFDIYTASLLFLLFNLIINYFMIYAALHINSEMMVRLLTTVIISGVVASMITNSDNHWWETNLSFLGTKHANYSWQFNLTLMVSALLMTGLIDYLFVWLHRRYPADRGLNILRILLTTMAICLFGVGGFANNGDGLLHLLHDIAAWGLVAVFGLTVILIRWLLPKGSRQFRIISDAIAVLLIIDFVLFKYVGYFSLTAFQLVAFDLAFSWILLLLGTLRRLSHRANVAVTVTLENDDDATD
ncbi:AbrB/MazE/SpoVT family DNA-binding domain-containing protein [Schleiferilactobacillus perolens]|jgi:antitoxin component of MazEF toxin-antitoxin module|uniref:AbrB/MazE/SpoVT family DNA-binding domain-containing protein n=1 Tax=Schleiferilactobacillus perolens TaxID=100468 RepID=UPI002357D07C|nr:AbrB/MazE/SpoVT family DNA-binding domain-containing protein [Schleiferilactobacillus perolens]MCI2170530.1 AbrB/MazE/SpoVT family DNA-binding domain-containing protein [Schleiferilactobacillus perolens]